MSKIKLIIEERTANIGQFKVGRLLPFRKQRMIGPFIYIDHMGPVSLSGDENFDVLPHPHIGLSTLTYLFEGSIMHRDTLGNAIEILPGAVNWMTAGKGIVHSERTPDHLRDVPINMHGLQIWVALPKDYQQIEPEFSHIEKDQLPSWRDGDLHFKLIAGEAFARKSPVPVFSKLYMLELESQTQQPVKIGEQLYGESGLYILKGGVSIDGKMYGPNQLLVANDSSFYNFIIEKDSMVFIFGGEPFLEQRFIDWNFVSSSQQLISEAKHKWEAQAFDKIQGDEEEFIPYPPLT